MIDGTAKTTLHSKAVECSMKLASKAGLVNKCKKDTGCLGQKVHISQLCQVKHSHVQHHTIMKKAQKQNSLHHYVRNETHIHYVNMVQLLNDIKIITYQQTEQANLNWMSVNEDDLVRVTLRMTL